MDYFKKIKEHWLISIIILCGIVFGATWLLDGNLAGDEREKSKNVTTQLESAVEKSGSQPNSIGQSEDLQDNEKKSLLEGTAFASKFGFTVYISGSDGDLKNANIFITLKNQKDRNYTKVNIGQKIKIKHENSNYLIEIDDIRGDWVDLTIRKSA